MGDLRIECRFKNAVLYNAMVEVCGRLALEEQAENKMAGLPLIRATSEHTGVNRATISRLLNLKDSPYSAKNGRPLKQAIALADMLGKPFSELFPPTLYALRIPNVLVKEVNSEEVLSLEDARKQKLLPSILNDATNDVDMREVVDGALAQLSHRQEKVIRMRFGLDGEEMSLEAIGDHFSVGRERIRQIEARALRQLRHPSVSHKLRLAI